MKPEGGENVAYVEISTLIVAVNRDDHDYWLAWANKKGMEMPTLVTRAISEFIGNYGKSTADVD